MEENPAFVRALFTEEEARSALYDLLEPVAEDHDMVGDAIDRLPTAELQQWAYVVSLVATGTSVYPVKALR